MTLKELHSGETAIIEETGGEKSLKRHFLNMGLIPGTVVKVEKYAPLGDPIKLHIHSYKLTVRSADAEKIKVIPLGKDTNFTKSKVYSEKKYSEPPSIIFDEKSYSPVGKMTFALVGNQNCGKTTLFNALTGSNSRTGNFPGVTVDYKIGKIKGYENITVTDLPGIYSLSPYSPEEIITREYIFNKKPDCIINIIDATNIERNLYLTMQLMQLEIPIVLALNMIDEVNANGGIIKTDYMGKQLGVPVVPISAVHNEGIDMLTKCALQAVYKKQAPNKNGCLYNRHTNAVGVAVKKIASIINHRASTAKLPIYFAAEKIIESDVKIIKKLNLSDKELNEIEQITEKLEAQTGTDRITAAANMRFSFIYQLCDRAIFLPAESKETTRTGKIDSILTGKYTAFPSLLLIMTLIFYITFNLAGPMLQQLLQFGLEKLSQITDRLLISGKVNETVRKLIIDGIFSGVGSVIAFLPIIIILFFFLSLLEDSGYMARIAFITDKLLRKIGLSGRSIVPMLIGFGCTVPAVLATRTISSRKDKCLTVMLIPFMSCTAKLPVYGFIVQTFFPDFSGLLITGLYFLGIAVAVIVALVLKNTLFKGETDPLILELPNYRMPGTKSVLLLLRDKIKDFLSRAFTIIFLASIIIWFLQTYDLGMNIVSDLKDSILAHISGLIAPIFIPLGLSDWRPVASLISGFVAKECVVSTLKILSVGVPVGSFMSSPSAVSMLVFCLLYTPCIAAVASVKRELGIKWAAVVIIGQCGIAWICALFARAIFLFFSLI